MPIKRLNIKQGADIPWPPLLLKIEIETVAVVNDKINNVYHCQISRLDEILSVDLLNDVFK